MPNTQDKLAKRQAQDNIKSRINELKDLLDDGETCVCQMASIDVCDHNWSLCNEVRDRITTLEAEYKRLGGTDAPQG